MIKSITVTNYLDESIIINLSNPKESGLIISKIEGLNPPKAEVNIAQISTMDGGQHNLSRLPSRNIVIHLDYYKGNESIESLRLKTYKYFPIKQKLKLLIKTDKRTAEIEGIVELNEIDIFSKRENAVISILCPKPYFSSLEQNYTIFSGIVPMFEFPFFNEINTDTIEFGSIVYKEQNVVRYDGDAEVGVKIIIHITSDSVSNITVYNTTSRQKMAILTDKITELTGQALKKSDEIIINTVKGEKYVHLLRDGKEINILNCLNRNTDWFILKQGDNLFAYTASAGTLDVQFKIIHQTMYEGV